MAQGGDFIGGESCGLISNYKYNSRKAMNSFICSTDRRFTFTGRINEDVNVYTTQASRGSLFLTIPHIALEQKPTQSNQGGMTDIYAKGGTYLKSFYTVLQCPSSVTVELMGFKSKRLHHRVKWKNTTPMILKESVKK
jgi:hypothetical protein